KAEITPRFEARVQKLFREEGDRISKGQPLLQLDTTQLILQQKKDRSALEVQKKEIGLSRSRLILARQRVERDFSTIEKAKATLAEAKAQADNARRTLQNKTKLHEIGAVSDSELKGVQTAYASAEAALLRAEKDFENQKVGYRKEDLKQAGLPVPEQSGALQTALVGLNTIIEKAELEKNEATLQSIQATLETTEWMLRESTVRSPLTGVVASRDIDLGEMAKPDKAMFVVIDTRNIYLSCPIGEKDLGRIDKGQKASLKVDAYPDDSFQGKIELISPIIDPQSRTVNVRIIISNPDLKLKTGMFARGEIEDAAPDRVFLVPEESVMAADEPGKGWVFFETEEGFLFKKPVQIVESKDNQLEIRGDLKEGDRIAVGALSTIKEGDRAPEKGERKK
ncbi:MAG: efflux RND transporter periplasmic adaptor subunit, partial [Leptospiraceae bacterium]|nr:efflux RND transporter periplasmic adaptor subunit [Leptospiraceae bacterium]